MKPFFKTIFPPKMGFKKDPFNEILPSKKIFIFLSIKLKSLEMNPIELFSLLKAL